MRRDGTPGMKTTPRSDYPVRVRPRVWDEPEPAAPHYAGVYDVTLNSLVDIAFVPHLTTPGPPFDPRALPDNFDLIDDPQQARLAAVLLAQYVVTPDPGRAGSVASFERIPDEGPVRGVLFFVSPELFSVFERELGELSEMVGGLHPAGTVHYVADRAVIRFLREWVVTSDLFRPEDAALLQSGHRPEASADS
jgi:hypothetical protein